MESNYIYKLGSTILFSVDSLAMVRVGKSNGKHRQEITIHKPTIQLWNGNETREEFQNRQCEGRSGRYLPHTLQDMGEVVSHGGLELQGAEIEGGDTGVGILSHQTRLKAARV